MEPRRPPPREGSLLDRAADAGGDPPGIIARPSPGVILLGGATVTLERHRYDALLQAEQAWQAHLEALAEAPGKVSTLAPPTSRKAGTQKPPRFGSQRWEVLQAISRTNHGRTAAEVTDYLNRPGGRDKPISRNQVATRLLELREAGLVQYRTDEKGAVIVRPTGPKDTGAVHFITLAGEAALGYPT